MQKILLVPHPILRQKAKDINELKDEDISIAKKMMEIMNKAPGLGLAANQIGVLKKIVTVNIQDKKKDIKKQYILFNPKIVSYSKNTNIMEEGCLSIPEQFAEIERPEEIIVEYINEKKKIVKKKVSGIESRVLQHEIDHLSGKLFIDYLSSLKRNIMIRKVKKLVKVRKTNE
tara:strand:- start:66 stop:584 length:519 start_codon:yes stop_codon:yes gene_type:complete